MMGKKVHGAEQKMIWITAMVLCLIFLGGCGGKGTGEADRLGRYFLMDVQEREYPKPKDAEKTRNQLSVQFHEGELLQIQFQVNAEGNGFDLYLCHEDGSSEAVMSDIPKEYIGKKWFMDRDGDFYLPSLSGIIKLNRDGEQIYERTGNEILDICQMQDGRILLLVQVEGGVRLAELEKDTGTITVGTMELDRGVTRIGTMEDKLILLDNNGFWEVNPEDSTRTCVMDFRQASYEMEAYKVSKFRLLEDGRAELLDSGGIKLLEVLDVGELREIVLVRDWKIDNRIRSCSFQFNQENEDYYVVLEECDEGTDIVDFRNRTGIDMATGKGADIICSDAMESVLSYLEKGLLEDLTPYIEKSGLREEDYFPAAFGHWRSGGKIYGVELSINPTAIWIDEELLGGREVTEIETLVENMAAYDGDKKWFWEPDWILHYLLRGSENLWGMIDWKAGTCDFTGELFLHMLEIAKRQGGDYGKENLLAGWAQTGFASVESQEQMEREGRVFVGFLFDDGGHVLANEYGTIGINSKSPCKDGAWEFIRYMLSEEVQKGVSDNGGLAGGYSFPVNRAAADALAEKLITDYEKGRFRISYENVEPATAEDIKRNQKEVFRIVEDARFAPIKTGEILEIILEEAEAYFDGAKEVQEVIEIIQNRAGLYLGEQQ